MSDFQGKDKCPMAKRRGRNNIMKFMSNTKAQSLHKAALSLTHHLTCLQKLQIPPRLSRCPSHERADKQTVRGHCYLTVLFPPAKSQVREVGGLFFLKQECVVARSHSEVNRIVWSYGNSVSMTSSESSQEWKGKEISSQGENGGI